MPIATDPFLASIRRDWESKLPSVNPENGKPYRDPTTGVIRAGGAGNIPTVPAISPVLNSIAAFDGIGGLSASTQLVPDSAGVAVYASNGVTPGNITADRVYFGNNGVLRRSGYDAIDTTSGPLYLMNAGGIRGSVDYYVNARYGVGVGFSPDRSLLRPVSDGVAKLTGNDGVTLGTLQAGTLQAGTGATLTENSYGQAVLNGTAGVNIYRNGAMKWQIGSSDTIVHHAVKPSADNTLDLGSGSRNFRTGYFGTSVETPIVTSDRFSLEPRTSSSAALTTVSNGHLYLTTANSSAQVMFEREANFMSNDVVGTHIQNVGTGDSPTFASLRSGYVDFYTNHCNWWRLATYSRGAQIVSINNSKSFGFNADGSFTAETIATGTLNVDTIGAKSTYVTIAPSSRLAFGGTGGSQPMLVDVGSVLRLRNVSNTEYADFECGDISTSGTLQVGTIKTPSITNPDGILSLGAATFGGTISCSQGTSMGEAFGAHSSTSDGSAAFGRSAICSDTYTIALGSNSVASGYASQAMGPQTRASGAAAIALGPYANASHYKSIALGFESATTKDHQFVFGGANSTDHINEILINSQGPATITNTGGTLDLKSAVTVSESLDVADGGFSVSKYGTVTSVLADQIFKFGTGNTFIQMTGGSTVEMVSAGQYCVRLYPSPSNCVAIGAGSSPFNPTETLHVGGAKGSLLVEGNATFGGTISCDGDRPRNETFGDLASSTGAYGVTIGWNASTTGNFHTALGYNANASGNGVSIGAIANATANAVAVGKSSDAAYSNSISLGCESATTKMNQMVAGSLNYPINEILINSQGPATITNTGGVLALGDTSYGANIAFRSGSSDPTTLDLAAGYKTVWHNTTTGELRDFINKSGVMYKSAAYSVV